MVLQPPFGMQNMPKVMKAAAILSLILTIAASWLFRCLNQELFLTLAITFGTTFYHLGIRLLIGFLYNLGMKNHADYTKKWYQPRPWEGKLYKVLRVKAWKDKMPTYRSSLFSRKDHTWDEIAQAMCQSELVHETNMLLSFLPVIASKWFGSFSVFLITSICGAIFDLLFVIMQRYNRPRVIKIAVGKRSNPIAHL